MEITKWSRYANTDHSLCRKPRPGNSSLARANVTAHRRQEPMSREFNDWVDQTNHARPKARDKLAGYLHDGMTPANSMSTCGRTEKQQRHTLPIIFIHNKDKLKVLYLEEGNGYITDQ